MHNYPSDISRGQFKKYVAKLKNTNPLWFCGNVDSLSDSDDIRSVELEFGLTLPKQYKEFVKEYGGGDFAFTNVFSCDKEGDWYIFDKNKKAKPYLPENFIAISDDESGGYYGYLVKQNKLDEKVYYWDYENRFIDKIFYKDLWSYLVKTAFTPVVE